MSKRRTAWHFLFGIHLRRHGSPDFEIHDEVSLSDEPLRMDFMVLRRTRAKEPSVSPRTTLRRLWQRLSLVTVVELKSIGRPYRTDDLDRLWSYVHLCRIDEKNRPPRRSDLRAVLIVPARTPALLADVDEMGLRWKNLGGGYWRLRGGLFSLYVVEIDVVCEQEDDDHLRAFAHQPQRTSEGRQFWARLVGSQEVGMELQEMEDYDEVIQKLLNSLTPEQRLAGLAPEQRLAGLAPEQRLAGLAPEQIVAALPDAVLQALPDDYLATLPEPVRSAVRKRLGR
ncbi:uncharacterized protein SOCEGT47_002680 [Sorangium cellulosum]|uniref:Uncharacterized protein n=1 Tax=Sorangium cellulosum TaxID=56 RepID=A0A4P2PT53_SORCE|nr:hypothetical protein [Sorangium cellulosum]AUX19815.1 uncharacterized protein SOCEGT47_002680 [Sorangium cellulosum]